ncbi:MAG: 3-deoxy-D-manno-octulosonic acid transferase, partial [Proteobacteria bacterium]|nr:3-deoxy-D-manno-octulosonic acid transferase [Pseudomonadota bacterium]
FHAVSLGETRAVMPLLRSFKERRPEVSIVLSTVTQTGRELALKEGRGLVERVIYMPLDLSWVVKRALRDVAPALFIVVEKEYWPNMIRFAHSSNVPVVVINATISERSYKRYSFLSFLFAGVFKKISLFCAKRDEDAKRATALGIEKNRVHRVGNIKFDMEDTNAAAQIEGLRDALGITKDDKVIVAGSTHEGEELIVLEAFRELKKEHPKVKLIIAPRHPNRFDEVERTIKEAGFEVKRRSQCGGSNDAVLLLDTVGELFLTYALASINFVGGSLTPVGGHNLLEPAYHSTPVLYGPYVETCRDMANLLEEAGGSIMVSDKETLTVALASLLKDNKRRLKMGKSAKAALEANKGATIKTIELIEELGAL